MSQFSLLYLIPIPVKSNGLEIPEIVNVGKTCEQKMNRYD
jgi:hypothetical protein